MGARLSRGPFRFAVLLAAKWVLAPLLLDAALTLDTSLGACIEDDALEAAAALPSVAELDEVGSGATRYLNMARIFNTGNSFENCQILRVFLQAEPMKHTDFKHKLHRILPILDWFGGGI